MGFNSGFKELIHDAPQNGRVERLSPIACISTQWHKSDLKLDVFATERPRQMTSGPTCILYTPVRK